MKRTLCGSTVRAEFKMSIGLINRTERMTKYAEGKRKKFIEEVTSALGLKFSAGDIRRSIQVDGTACAKSSIFRGQ